MASNNIEKQMLCPEPDNPNKKERVVEKEKFEPKIIFDFIRHGQAEYGTEVADKMKNMGYDFRDHLPTSRISNEKISKREVWEGRVTQEGQEQLRQAIGGFIERIDMEKDVLMMLSGSRFRHEQSGEIILDELEKNKVNVHKAREHQDLVDFKKNWISILEFVKDKTKQGDNPWQYWLKMSEDELKDADLEGIEDITKRMEHFIELIKRYARRYQEQLGLDEKVLRILAPTSDINILSLMQKNKLSDLEQNIIKNAEIVELGVNKNGEAEIMIK